MTNWLDELDAAAERAQNVACGGGTSKAIDRLERLLIMRSACSPERIRALIACVRAADRLPTNEDVSSDYIDAYYAARTALDRL